mmetsp:Transcript_6434/g.22133  ORF Transcript_6434/g.22133 Transcript_6434/m.22133 type:complete len:249 (+) Transcript_6434:1002-1748(+)
MRRGLRGSLPRQATRRQETAPAVLGSTFHGSATSRSATGPAGLAGGPCHPSPRAPPPAPPGLASRHSSGAIRRLALVALTRPRPRAPPLAGSRHSSGGARRPTTPARSILICRGRGHPSLKAPPPAPPGLASRRSSGVPPSPARAAPARSMLIRRGRENIPPRESLAASGAAPSSAAGPAPLGRRRPAPRAAASCAAASSAAGSSRQKRNWSSLSAVRSTWMCRGRENIPPRESLVPGRSSSAAALGS